MPPENQGENPQGQDQNQGQQSNAGAIDYSKIDWKAIDWSKVPTDAVPESVVKETKFAKDLLTETIERRRTITEMKKALGEKPAEEPAKPAKTPEKQADMPEWARQLVDVNQQLMQEVQAIKTGTQANAIKAATDKAMADYKLPEKARQFLKGDTVADIEAQAKELSTMFVPNDTTSPGNTGTLGQGDIQSRAKAIIESRIKGAKPVADTQNSLFDKSFHRIS